MLSTYTKDYNKAINQILLISKKGIVIDFESTLYKSIKNTPIKTLDPFFNTVFSLLKNSNKTYTFNCVNLTIDGEIYTIDSQLHTNKENENAVFVFNDLTKQYKNFQKVSQKGNEATLKSQLFDLQNTAIQKKEEFRDNFITNLSHEIRLPITTIAEFATLLENTNLQQEQLYSLNVIKNTNEKLMFMLNDILDISKIQTGHFNIYESRFNFLNELQIINDIFERKCDEKGLKLVVNIDKNCPEFVISDKYRMAQIANNLLGNAIKFTNKGSITLLVKPLKNNNKNSVSIEFTIQDTGVGIPKLQQKHIFKSFYQIENSVKNNGNGLGLAITKHLIEALNGEITVTSELNKGTQFKVVLDFKISTDNAPDKIVKKSSEETKHYEYKILVAEPLTKDKVTLLKILNQTKKYDVTIVETGDDVIEELQKHHFHALIINLKLPITDGIDTARFIRFSKKLSYSKIPILAVSQKPTKEEEKMCKEKRINSYIGKPYNKPELLRKLNYLLRKKPQKRI